MINFFTLQALNFFDFLYKKKILDFLKSLKLRNLDIIIDVGAHEGEMQSFFLKNFKSSIENKLKNRSITIY